MCYCQQSEINEKIFGYVGDNHKISGLSINKNLEEAPTILSFLKDDKTIKTDFLNKLSNIDFFSGYRKIANEISTKESYTVLKVRLMLLDFLSYLIYILTLKIRLMIMLIDSINAITILILNKKQKYY